MIRPVVIYSLIVFLSFAAVARAQEKPVFEEDILPILSLNCTGCHGSNDPQAGLNMESIVSLMQGGRSGKAIVPGDSKNSLLFQLISGAKQPAMPPEPLLPLEDSDIALIQTWIDSGTSSINPPVVDEPQPKETKASAPNKTAVPTIEPSSAPDKEPGSEKSNTQTDPFFQKFVLPIVEEKCSKCHQGEQAKAGLKITQLDSVLQEKFISPHHPEQSLLYTAITGLSAKSMPPKSQPQLSGTEKEIIRRWIASLSAESKPKEIPPEETKPAQKSPAETATPKTEAPASIQEITFEQHILPILQTNCAGCHGENNPKANLNVTRLASILDGQFVIPNKPDESLLNLAISGLSEKRMPPQPMPPLQKEEISLIQKWIAQGAKHGSAIKPQEDEAVTTSLSAVKEGEYAHSQIGSIAFHPQKPLLAVGRLYEVQLFDYDTESRQLTLKAVFPGHSHLVRALQFSPDGNLLAAGGGRPALQGEILLWNTDTWQLEKKIEGHRDNIYALAFSPDGSTLASCSYDRTLMMWNTETGNEISTLEDHVDSVYDIAFHPDGTRLASAAGDRTLKIWNPATAERLYTLSDAEKELYALAFHPTGKFVAAGGVDRMIRIWELGESDGYQVQSKFAHDGAILDLAYSPDGSMLYSSSDDNHIKAWDTETYLEKTVFENQSDWVFSLDISTDGSWLAAGRYDGTFDVYDTASGKSVLSYSREESPKVSVATPAGQQSSQPPNPTVSFASTNTASDSSKENVNTDPFQVGALEGTGTYPSFITSLNPKVVTYGNQIEFTLQGKNLDGLDILPGDSSISVEIIEITEGEVQKFVRSEFDTGRMIVDTGIPYTVKFTLTIPNDVRPGIHRLQVRTPLAMTNSLPFLVEEQVAIHEQEDNDDWKNAQWIDLPNILAGSMNTMGDMDVFAFEVAAGEELTFDVIAGALGSAIDSRLVLMNAEGQTVSRSIDYENGRDAKLGHRFDTSGTYYIQITDSLLRQGGFYRLHVTRRPFITGFFPIGVQKDTETEVWIKGFNLDGKTSIPVNVPADYSGDDYPLPFENAAGKPIQPVRLAVQDEPTIHEAETPTDIQNPQSVSIPVHINGTIYDAESNTDADYFRFSAQPNQPLVIEVAAQRYGSPLDSKIEILHPNGEPVEIATVRSVAQTYTVLADRDSRSRGLRLNSWKDFEINDYVMVGTEILRIDKLPDYPDEDVLFSANTRRGWRTAFLGTTPGHHAVDTKVYKVEIHPPHSEFPPNGLPIRRLHAQNDDGGAPIYGKDSYFLFHPPADADYILRLTDAQADNHPSNTYQLSIHPPQPDFKLFVNADQINIPRGGKIPISVTIDRYDGFDGEVMIDIPHLPDGFRCSLTHIPPGEESSSFILEALPDAVSTDPDQRFTVDAYSKINGEWVKRSGNFGSITVTFDPDIKCTQEPQEITLVPGGTAKITVKASRHNGFNDRIPIDLRNLPHGVYVLDTGLNGIMIQPGETERSFTLYAEPWVQPEALTVFSVLQVETRSALPNIYATAPSVLNITLDPQAIAQSDSEYLQQKKKY